MIFFKIVQKTNKTQKTQEFYIKAAMWIPSPLGGKKFEAYKCNNLFTTYHQKEQSANLICKRQADHSTFEKLQEVRI